MQGLVAQGRTATEALEIARDVSRKLIEAQAQRSGEIDLAGDIPESTLRAILKQAAIDPEEF